MENKTRAFIALELPTRAKKSIEDIQTQLKGILQKSNIRWIPKSNWHCTLKFLGDLSPKQCDNIQEILQNISSEFRIINCQINQWGAFPQLSKPKILFASLESYGNQINRIALNIEKECAKIGLKEEQKSFTPHITFARIKALESAERRQLLKMSDNLKTTVEFKGDAIHLIKSELFPEGASYSILATYPLSYHE